MTSGKGSRSTPTVLSHVDYTHHWSNMMKMALYLFGLSLQNLYNNLIMRNSENPTKGTVYKIPNQLSSKLSSHQTQGKCKKLSQLKGA